MELHILALASCVLSAVWFTAQVDARSKYVTVNLDAKWASTPLLLEASEFLAKESNDHFWKFVQSINNLDYSTYGDQHDEANYQMVLKFAGRLLTPLQLGLLKFSLSLRAHSPTVEMHNQLAREKNPPENCEVFVDINNLVTCEMAAMKAFLPLAHGQPTPETIKSDHHYLGHTDRPVTVILYAQLATEVFTEWHNTLAQLTEEGKINYILRHHVKRGADTKVRLSGYGVELAIKSTEYKALDDTKVEGEKIGKDHEHDEVQGFLFETLKDLYPDKEDNLKEFRQHLVDSSGELAPLKVWQLQDLSFQAAQKVMSAAPEDKLRTLRDISQNFPTQSRLLVKTTVKDKLKKEVEKNQQLFGSTFGLEPGESAMFVNGLQADLDVYDVFTLLETMKSEAKLMEGLHDLGKQYEVPGEEMMKMLTIDLREAENNYAVDIRDDAIVWINNIEKDRKYSGWPSSLQELLRPTFPGMLRHIRKNMFHVVFMVNPADMKYKELLKMAEAFYVHNAPVRVGFLFLVNDAPEVDATQDAGVALIRAFNYVSKKESGVKALSFFTDVYETVQDEELTAAKVISEFTEQYTAGEAKKVFGPDSEYDQGRQEAARFFHKTGLGQSPQVLMNGVPFSREAMEPDEFEETVVSAILKVTPDLQRAVYNGQLYDGLSPMEYLMTRDNVMPRLNSRVFAAAEKYLDLTKHTEGGASQSREAFNALPAADMTSVVMNSMNYMTKKDEVSVQPVTDWVVADLDSPEGRTIVYQATKHLKRAGNVRVGVIHNPTTLPSADNKEEHFISRAAQVAMATLTPTMAKSFVAKLMKEENVEALRSGEKTLEDLAVSGMDFAAYQSQLDSEAGTFYFMHSVFCDKVLEFKPGQRGIVTNGKVLGPLRDDEDFIQEDFDLLEKVTSKVAASKIEEKVRDLGLDERGSSDLVLRIASLLASVPQKEARKDVTSWGDQHSVVKLPPRDPDVQAYHVVAILDPTTRAAQKYTPLIMVLQEVANVNIKIFMNCRDKLSEMPLKSYYRYVLQPEVTFKVDSSLTSGPFARFTDMPEAPLLTMGMDPPESWLVESVRAVHDLDNIRMGEVDTEVSADFELEYLLLEGHCYDSTSGQPPRGLQFILGSKSKPDIVDTIVMANLGYFQLKATPGAWVLALRPGRSREIYEIASHDYTDSPADSEEVVVVIDNFKSKIIRVRVNKKRGQEKEDLLAESKVEKKTGIWDSISNTLGGGSTSGQPAAPDKTLNIFSLASGHLYERLMRIMMSSVLKHTQTKVKFWFLKNYLSPSFKDFIPHMAKEYGFEYELVQYKWPRWLHQQTEKQRIIWGYKILFLDVLFPLNIDKFIFVDADQIVRADLQELVDLDLEGAPYGYTPFCDSRTEMDGFRFWKSGYWASHLAGRKYHISALYVVDLKKFRKIAAGDRLRGQYQGLSQDPNSLSNLDQDLPNNMIHQVAIKSLPQEWLWCETWCSDSQLATAKTIDLCNNPRTKEPKLEAAQRIVPEWKDYDNAIKGLWERVYNKDRSPPPQGEAPTDAPSQDQHIEL